MFKLKINKTIPWYKFKERRKINKYLKEMEKHLKTKSFKVQIKEPFREVIEGTYEECLTEIVRCKAIHGSCTYEVIHE